jgi:hypothetical protein
MADPNVTIASNSQSQVSRPAPKCGIKLPPVAADYYLMTMRAAELELQ